MIISLDFWRKVFRKFSSLAFKPLIFSHWLFLRNIELQEAKQLHGYCLTACFNAKMCKVAHPKPHLGSVCKALHSGEGGRCYLPHHMNGENNSQVFQQFPSSAVLISWYFAQPVHDFKCQVRFSLGALLICSR